ncbi:MAG: prepilin peptidase [Cyanobacteria bacterium TGS_CYA1]|nr:prepilin peptidase [Cyanobacteria bacterium TGS_CYA1]
MESFIDAITDFLTSSQYASLRMILAPILGICIGSFLNVVALRSLAEKSWIHPPSHCPNCKHKLGFLDLIPVLSFMMLKGICRYCNQTISLQYPLTEIFTGLIFFFVSQTFGWTLTGLAMAFFSCTLIAVTLTDLKEKLIPHEITYPSMLLGILYSSFLGTGFFNTMAGVGISYVLFDFIDFYGLVSIRWFQGANKEDEDETSKEDQKEVEEECDPSIDRNFEIIEPNAKGDNKKFFGDDEDDVVMGGGDAVLAAVIAAWLGMEKMLLSVALAFLVGSVMGACYVFTDMKRRGTLKLVIKPAIWGFVIGLGLMCLPLGAVAFLSHDTSTWLTPNLALLALAGGVCGGLVSAVFTGSRFSVKFPFGPSLATGAFLVMLLGNNLSKMEYSGEFFRF